MNELALFAGAGGGILGGKLLGWRTRCAVEIDSYARKVLLARQRDGFLEPFPIWDDVTTFDGRRWEGSIDVVSGGFPCQDISSAGKKAGIDGSKSGLWAEMARIICEVQPRFVFVENSPMLTFRGIDRVLGDLATMGYDARWGVFGAYHAGAPHKRERIFILAYPMQQGRQDGRGSCGLEGRKRFLSDADKDGRGQNTGTWDGKWPLEPDVVRVLPNGLADGLDMHYAIGNGQVPAVVRIAWETLTKGI